MILIFSLISNHRSLFPHLWFKSMWKTTVLDTYFYAKTSSSLDFFFLCWQIAEKMQRNKREQKQKPEQAKTSQNLRTSKREWQSQHRAKLLRLRLRIKLFSNSKLRLMWKQVDHDIFNVPPYVSKGLVRQHKTERTHHATTLYLVENGMG